MVGIYHIIVLQYKQYKQKQTRTNNTLIQIHKQYNYVRYEQNRGREKKSKDT